MRLTEATARNIKEIYREAKADLKGRPVPDRVMLACKLYNQRFHASIDTEDVIRALKHIDPETKRERDRQFWDEMESLCRPSKSDGAANDRAR